MSESILETLEASFGMAHARWEEIQLERARQRAESPSRLEIRTLEDFESHWRGPWKIPILIGESFETFEVDEIGPIYSGRNESSANAPKLREALASSVWLSSGSGEFLDPVASTKIDFLWRSAKRIPLSGIDPIGDVSFGAFILGAHFNGITIRSRWHKQRRELLTIHIDMHRSWICRVFEASEKREQLAAKRRWLRSCGIID